MLRAAGWETRHSRGGVEAQSWKSESKWGLWLSCEAPIPLSTLALSHQQTSMDTSPVLQTAGEFFLRKLKGPRKEILHTIFEGQKVSLQPCHTIGNPVVKPWDLMALHKYFQHIPLFSIQTPPCIGTHAFSAWVRQAQTTVNAKRGKTPPLLIVLSNFHQNSPLQMHRSK